MGYWYVGAPPELTEKPPLGRACADCPRIESEYRRPKSAKTPKVPARLERIGFVTIPPPPAYARPRDWSKPRTGAAHQSGEHLRYGQVGTVGIALQKEQLNRAALSGLAGATQLTDTLLRFEASVHFEGTFLKSRRRGVLCLTLS
jgi:hypothetical protein